MSTPSPYLPFGQETPPSSAPDFVYREATSAWVPEGASVDTLWSTPPPQTPTPAGPRRPWLVVTVAAIAIIGLVVAARVWAPPPVTRPACDPGMLCVTAEQVLRDYLDDIESAQATYVGQSVEITGGSLDAMRNDTGAYTAMVSVRGLGQWGESYLGCRDLPFEDVRGWEEAHPNTWKVVLTGVVISGQPSSKGGIMVALHGCRLKV